MSTSPSSPLGAWHERAKSQGLYPFAEPTQRFDTDGGSDNALIEQLLVLTQGASRRVWLKVPWWDVRVPEAKQVLDALLEAQARGVDCRVILRPDRECEAALKALRTAGVTVKVRRNEHAKELLADDQHLFFSMNLTRKEILHNQQAGVLTREPRDVAQHALLLEQDLAQDQVDASAGEELWREASQVVPRALLPLLPHTRLNPLQSAATPVVLDTDRHLLVVAPTGAGKTVIGQVAVLRAIKLVPRQATFALLIVSALVTI